MARDLPIVLTAHSLEEAHVVAAWLEERGISTFVKDKNIVGAMSYATPAFAPRGIEICVVDEPTAERARALLAEREKAVEPMDVTAPPLETTCKECGRTSAFPATQRGTVQSCPYCTAYVDIGEERSE
jgi:zona occludens toxin (predicted ATPase)